jgi:putative intracellular protease/amidase
MGPTSSQFLPRRGLVLVADGFEEQPTISCVRVLRDAGVAAALVGITPGLVTGSRGITVQPDLSLNQMIPDGASALVVIPGGRRCAASILTDPRVHRLVENTVDSGGTVAVLRTAAEEAERLLQIATMQQGALSIQEFVDRLLHEIPGGGPQSNAWLP